MLSKRVAEVNRSRCVACGACAKECPRGAVAVHRGCFAAVEPVRCVGCGKCAKVCPADCITLLEREGQA
ncbi:4Fe-4S binding protein [Pseudoflavonifractor intestinihominis]|uniref:4Fe-4S binding protein n=1 Tax=Pseudoflavonifractor intestinihominis TaxID=3133171 RepID=A0ABV1E908_9FIRM|nr:4Fe-4S binding protein [uncultured Pseudoflavonifractor sp.]